MDKIKNMKDKIPDVFYAMKQRYSDTNKNNDNDDDNDDNNKSNKSIINNNNNETQLRQRKGISSFNDYRSPRNRTKSEDYYSTDSTESDTDHHNNSIKKPIINEQLTPNQKFWKRFYSTWTMIFGFFFIIYIGHTALCLLVTVFQVSFIIIYVYIMRKCDDMIFRLWDFVK